MTHHTFPFVCVGGGMASDAAAQAVRESGADGPLCIVGSEPRAPYNRPPLSKEHLRGTEGGNIPLPIHDDSWYASNNITLLTNTMATGGDTQSRTITLDNGDTVQYEKLLVATGSAPKPLDVPGGNGANVLTLRTVGDSDALRGFLGGHVVLVGGGYIGVEVAASFLQTGGRATIVEPNNQLWSKFASPQYGAFLRDKLQAAGADVILEDEVVAVTDAGVQTEQGRTIDADVVVAAVGVAPNLDFARALGLNVDDKNGILVNARMETSRPNVWAAGDCAGFQDPVLGKQWRVEHWNNALWHGQIAGANMAGGNAVYNHVPRFFSEELDIKFKLFGDPQGGTGGLFHGDVSSNRFDELYVNDAGRVQMAITVNPPDALLPVLEKLVRQKPVVRGREGEISRADFDLATLLT